MRRWILFPVAGLLGAAQCTPLHTSIINGTGRSAFVRIWFDEGTPAFGNVAAGGVVNIEQRTHAIIRIQYRYDRTVCTLDGDEISGTVADKEFGLDRIILKAC